jgi:hypothetical protein
MPEQDKSLVDPFDLPETIAASALRKTTYDYWQVGIMWRRRVDPRLS